MIQLAERIDQSELIDDRKSNGKPFLVTLLEFICASHHRQGHVAKRDMVKKLIENPDLNVNNKRMVRLEVKTIKKLEFCRKIWKLYS